MGSEPEFDDNIEGFDLFGEDTAEEQATVAHYTAAIAKRRQNKRERLEKLSQRTTAEARALYNLNRELRQTVDIIPGVFTTVECERLVKAAEEAAAERGGWDVARHSAYPTTDVAVEDVGPDVGAFTRDCVQERIIKPTAAARGFSTEQLACVDMFFVKYHPDAQAGLPLHTDASVLSFNVLLSQQEDFEGGGTFFRHLDRTVKPDVGGAVVHDGKYEHAGVAISRGVRYLLVGFVETADWKRGLRGYALRASAARVSEHTPEPEPEPEH